MITFNNTEEYKIALEADKVTKPTFVSIRNYTNKYGEVSNYLINLGTNYRNAQLADTALLSFLTPDSFEMHEDLIPHRQAAYDAILLSAKKNSSDDDDDHTMMSLAQRDTYDVISNNIKMHKEKGIMYLFGMLIKKTTVTQGNYPTVNSRPLTKAKNIIRKELSTGNYRQFYLDNISSIKINGQEIIIEL